MPPPVPGLVASLIDLLDLVWLIKNMQPNGTSAGEGDRETDDVTSSRTKSNPLPNALVGRRSWPSVPDNLCHLFFRSGAQGW